jgi:hypothetical protein
MKLKLDLHPIHSDGARIEASLLAIIDEAIVKRASEVEIIPGKGSGALKKSVLRFLDRPEIKARYHRLDKDSDNWGRLFVYFRHEPPVDRPVRQSVTTATAACVCCQAPLVVPADELPAEILIECPACGSPNRIAVHVGRGAQAVAKSSWGYE